MFEKDLAAKFQRVFDMKKVTYDAVSDSHEQECLFINVISCKSQVKDKKFCGKVTGKINIFGNADKLPYGYMSKRVQKCDPLDVKDLFFYDFEENVNTMENIVERTASFIYLFEMQYDPNLGEINELINDFTMEPIQ
jgi:hypothetical protein